MFGQGDMFGLLQAQEIVVLFVTMELYDAFFFRNKNTVVSTFSEFLELYTMQVRLYTRRIAKK